MGQYNKVLIVEDEEILAGNLVIHLGRCGWETRIAPTGEQAMTAASEFRPQLILLDFHLPDMDGFQALDAIRAARVPCACVLMTGHPTDTVLAEARRHGIDHILCKPFPLADVESCLAIAGTPDGTDVAHRMA